MDGKTVVHLHNEILCSRKKEGTPTFCNGKNGTGDYRAKGNKPVSERQIPYDLTYEQSNEQNKLTNKIEPETWKHGTL